MLYDSDFWINCSCSASEDCENYNAYENVVAYGVEDTRDYYCETLYSTFYNETLYSTFYNSLSVLILSTSTISLIYYVYIDIMESMHQHKYNKLVRELSILYAEIAASGSN